MSAACPVCQAPQDEGLMCANDVLKLEQLLRSIPGLVQELDVTLAKMARIGTAGKAGKGSAHTKTPIHLGAAAAAWELRTTLVKWANQIQPTANLIAHSAMVLLAKTDHIRRHPDVATLVDEITDAVTQARHTIDRPEDRVFLGPCWNEIPDVGTCYSELYAKHGAGTVRCRDCLHVHDVNERRELLLTEASDRLFTVREAARMVGKVGDKPVTEASIRGLIHRKRIAYRPGTNTIRLGDLLDVLTTRAATTTVAI